MHITDTVPVNKIHLTDTVSVNKMDLTDTISVNMIHLIGIVFVNKMHLTGTLWGIPFSKMTTPSRKLRHTAEASLTVFTHEKGEGRPKNP